MLNAIIHRVKTRCYNFGRPEWGFFGNPKKYFSRKKTHSPYGGVRSGVEKDQALLLRIWQMELPRISERHDAIIVHSRIIYFRGFL